MEGHILQNDFVLSTELIEKDLKRSIMIPNVDEGYSTCLKTIDISTYT